MNFAESVDKNGPDFTTSCSWVRITFAAGAATPIAAHAAFNILAAAVAESGVIGAMTAHK
jgi:hypothetical protein